MTLVKSSALGVGVVMGGGDVPFVVGVEFGAAAGGVEVDGVVFGIWCSAEAVGVVWLSLVVSAVGGDGRINLSKT